MQKLIRPELSAFSYDPRWGEIRLGAEPSLYFLIRESVFFVDKNPMGERDFSRISAPDISFFNGEVCLEFVSPEESLDYVVCATSKFDGALFEFVDFLSSNPDVHVGDSDDKLDISCEFGLVKSCYITRLVRDAGPRSVRLVRESDGVYLVIPSPRYRSRVISVAVIASELMLECEDGGVFRIALRLPGVIGEFFAGLINEAKILDAP